MAVSGLQAPPPDVGIVLARSQPIANLVKLPRRRDASTRALAVLAALAALATRVNAQVAVPTPDDRRPGSSLSAGGEVRQEYEWFANEEWGAEVPDHSGYWLQRYMLHVDAWLSRRLRLYGELKSGIEVGRAGGPRGSDEDRLDLHQGFVDVSFDRVTVRVGRQELAFGSQRLVSFREGPNMRQSFDGGSVVVQRDRWRAHGFGSAYVSTETGVFDDRWQVKEYLSLTGNASMFTAGPFVRESGPARTIRFLAGWATYRF